ncbi:MULTISPECIES: MBL fold metallo-hydrolase [Aquimarina]|uniref:MBL fold metallo-hydrolase n=1 Tax=Aquimarina TaxID=290174 RepID=UPI000D696D3F|nr:MULTISPECIES: MBL fold metallo-hydrolase [Aquimarina]
MNKYLKLNVGLEALVDRWYAWPHIISPATAAMNIKERHLKIMQSYIKNPKIHFAAVNKPEMLGGPFIDYDGGRVEEIKELYEQTINKREKVLEFCEAVNDLNTIVQKEAKGYCLDSLYDEIPEILRGYVELYYDLNNHPNFRFFESLLYESEFYDESMQTISLQIIESDNSRSFCLSTPRLDDPNVIHLDIPFKNSVIDDLFKMKRQPGDVENIKEALNIPAEQNDLFESFFTTEPPKEYQKYEREGILTRYFGHACVLVETKEVSILVDPVISYDGYETDVNRYTIDDLPEFIDYVLITHNHQDHILFETLLQLRHKIGKIILPGASKGNLQDPSLRIMFNKIGFNNIIELDDMESVELDRCTITGLPFIGEHSDLDIRSKLCYHVELHNRFKILFAADSQNVEPMVYDRIHKIMGDVDVLFLGMECDGAPLSWLYGPLLPEPLTRDQDQSRRLAGSNFKQGERLVNIFNPKNVFIYAMGMEPWLEFISSIKYTDESKPIVESNRLIEECKKRGIDAVRLYGEKTIEY